MQRGTGLARGTSQLKRRGIQPKGFVPNAHPKKKAAPLLPVPPELRRAAALTRVDGEVRASPKTVEHRNGPLLAMAERRECLLRVPGVCNFDPATTVACHSNQSIHGKAGARKADDHYSVWGCHACHTWLDQEGHAYEIRVAQFALAMLRQLDEWKLVAVSVSESESNRRAARWALCLHGVAV